MKAFIKRTEAWELARAVLVLLGQGDEVDALEHAAKLIGKDGFEAADRLLHLGSKTSFHAFCTARTLGASDQTLREMLKKR